MSPTPYSDVNDLLEAVLKGAQAVLGRHLIGMYVEGSLANGGFDAESDVDFVIVTDQDVRGAPFEALRAMHERVAAIDSPWAVQLEGTYISRRALRRHDPAHAEHPNLERGPGERLKMVTLDRGWDIHRYILREKGITVLGPDPVTLVDPISPGQLRQAVRSSIPGWAARLLAAPEQMTSQGSQAYIVLTLCRALYTLQFGTIVPKPAAARWAEQTYGEPWSSLVQRAMIGRNNPDASPTQEDIQGTLEFIQFTLRQMGSDSG